MTTVKLILNCFINCVRKYCNIDHAEPLSLPVTSTFVHKMAPWIALTLNYLLVTMEKMYFKFDHAGSIT